VRKKVMHVLAEGANAEDKNTNWSQRSHHHGHGVVIRVVMLSSLSLSEGQSVGQGISGKGSIVGSSSSLGRIISLCQEPGSI
jgi:hypothetical protein